MKAYRHMLCLIAVIALTVPTAAQAKPKIVVLATGGTIAGAQVKRYSIRVASVIALRECIKA
jgi:L-asparaginase/Glu-tRNA(Gln) amidotransferase subunit D